MNIKIGVLGPVDSVQRILSVAQEFNDIQFIPFIYDDFKEMNSLLANNNFQVHQWMFSGVLNYTYAIKKKLISKNEATYPPLYGSSYFGTLLEAQLKEGFVYKRMSIDTIQNEEIEKTLSYYELPEIKYYNYPFNNYTYIHKLVDFHKELYNKGKTEIAITSTKSTYNQLQKLGIPVYRLSSSYLSIHFSLQVLIERAQADRYKQSQMAIIGCQVHFDMPDDETYYSFRMKHNELDVNRGLLHLAEKLNGSFMPFGDGLFYIFTTRSEIHSETERELFNLVKSMKEQSNLSLSFSIGYGRTVSEAEQHVRYGFQQKHKDTETKILLVDENKAITLKRSTKSDDLHYETVLTGKVWDDRLKRSGLSPGVVSKVISFSKQNNTPEFSSQDVARWLQSTERNGRRILSGLKKGGFVKQCGEMHSGARGRPRKVYCFKG